MNFTNRLVNPTPFSVEWKWNAGIDITINPDSSVDLSTDQAKDFQRGLPGSEKVQDSMRELGLFIQDMDRPYEVQALEALRACADHLNRRYNDMVNRLRRDRAEKGISENPEAFQEIVDQTGYGNLKKRADAISARAKFLGKTLDELQEKTTVQKIDPDRTVPFLNPPKVFPSPLALQMFLRDKGNEEVKKKWEEWHAAVTRPVKVAKKVEAAE